MEDLHVPETNGDTPLHSCLRGPVTIECLEAALEAGADANARNSKGQTPFHYAARYSAVGKEGIELLLRHGAAVNRIDNEGISVLHNAVQGIMASEEILLILLRNGADPDCRDQYGNPPLAYINSSSLTDSGKKQLSDLLIQATVIYKLRDLPLEALWWPPNSDILCLCFCDDETRRREMASFLDNCMEEVVQMCKDKVRMGCRLYDLLYEYCCTTIRTEKLVNPETRGYWLRNFKKFSKLIVSAIKYHNESESVDQIGAGRVPNWFT